jgi:hypothetical protein
VCVCVCVCVCVYRVCVWHLSSPLVASSTKRTLGSTSSSRPDCKHTNESEAIPNLGWSQNNYHIVFIVLILCIVHMFLVICVHDLIVLIV